MLKKILVALDGSENSEKSIPWVRRYAAPASSKVVLFRAVPLEASGTYGHLQKVEEARGYLQRFERQINYEGIPCSTAVRTGSPAEAILAAAGEEDADLVMMTTRGGSPVERWLVGGVTEQVLRLSPRPVLVVRSQMALPQQARVRRIVLPLDGSRLAEAAIPWARKLARLLKSKLVFLHVFPTGLAGLRTEAMENVDALKKRMLPICAELRAEGTRAAFLLQYGDPADRIVRFPDHHDLVLTTTHGFGGFKRWVFGSVAEKLIHASEVPVLVYKTPAQARERTVRQEAAS